MESNTTQLEMHQTETNHQIETNKQTETNQQIETNQNTKRLKLDTLNTETNKLKELIFKLRLGNIPKYSQSQQIKNFLTNLKLNYKNVKCAPKWDYAIIAFHNQLEQQSAFDALFGKVFKKNVVDVAKLKNECANQRTIERLRIMVKNDDLDQRSLDSLTIGTSN
jgi:hypothetical protein